MGRRTRSCSVLREAQVPTWQSLLPQTSGRRALPRGDESRAPGAAPPGHRARGRSWGRTSNSGVFLAPPLKDSHGHRASSAPAKPGAGRESFSPHREKGHPTLRDECCPCPRVAQGALGWLLRMGPGALNAPPISPRCLLLISPDPSLCQVLRWRSLSSQAIWASVPL